MYQINQLVTTPDGPGVVWGGVLLPDGTLGYHVFVNDYVPKPTDVFENGKPDRRKTREYRPEQLKERE